MAPGTSTPTPDKSSIGQTLKSLREAKGISQNDIASKMHLDPRFIVAIEEDQFDSLPDVIYVRGYIRSYSKLVGADADTLVKQFEAQGGNFEPEIIPEIRHSSQTSSSDKPVKAFTYLIVFALIVLLFAWWQSNYTMESPSFISQETPGTAIQPATVQTAPAPVQPAPQYQPAVTSYPTQTTATASFATAPTGYDNFNQPLNVAPATTDGMSSTVPADIPAGQPPVATVENGAMDTTGDMSNMDNNMPGTIPPVIDPMMQTVAVSTTTTTDATVQPGAEFPPATTATTNTGMVNATAGIPTGMSGMQPPIIQTTGPDQIVLKLTADSWIEIIDSTGAKVFFNLGRSGDVFNVRGTAPFDVLLGFSQAVTLEYNGRPFDAAPYSRAGVARFKLGE